MLRVARGTGVFRVPLCSFSSTSTARAEFAFQLQNIDKITTTGKHVINDVSLSFYHGAKIGILGSNGSGKSTIMKIMAGADNDFTGTRMAHPNFKIGYLAQEPELDETKTIIENVQEGCDEILGLLKRFDELTEKFGEDLSDEEMAAVTEEYGELQDKMDRYGAWDLEEKAAHAMKMLRVPRDEEGFTVQNLSGGEKRRVALARLILSNPDFLLLDEPTNHLDAASVSWLEKYLAEFKGTVLCVTHDRYFLDNVAGWMLEMVEGRALPFKGNYTAWLEHKARRQQEEEVRKKKRDKALEEELEWIRSPQKARQAKGKARLKNYEKMLAESGSERVSEGRIYIPPGTRLGTKVIECKNLTKTFGGRTLIKDLSFTIPPASIVGIVGPNGAGKTTLFRMITGEDKPTSGIIDVGKTVRLAYVDQSRDVLDPNARVWKEIAGGDFERITLGGEEINARAYAAWFNFKGEQQQRLVGSLSGGERNRVHLARVVRSGANVILLDEPTNDLDVDTVRSLEDALLSFAGCALVVSHDRWFLNRVATHILAFEEGDNKQAGSNLVMYEGNYDYYQSVLQNRLKKAKKK